MSFGQAMSIETARVNAIIHALNQEAWRLLRDDYLIDDGEGGYFIRYSEIHATKHDGKWVCNCHKFDRYECCSHTVAAQFFKFKTK